MFENHKDESFKCCVTSDMLWTMLLSWFTNSMFSYTVCIFFVHDPKSTLQYLFNGRDVCPPRHVSIDNVCKATMPIDDCHVGRCKTDQIAFSMSSIMTQNTC